MRTHAILVLCILSSCSGEESLSSASKPKNLLLVSFDTTRADHLGCYGYEEAHTPILDSLAEHGVLFENCFAPAPITLPSHASLLTGLRPPTHGARNNATHPLPKDIPTLAERFQREGFRTGAVVSALVLDSRYGLSRGFDLYDDNLSSADLVEDFMIRETTASDTTSRAIEALKQLGEGPWMLWVHYFDPHAEYIPPEEYLKLCPGRPYDAEISFADDQLGVLIDAIRSKGFIEDTLIAMTADHGESLGDHGERTHGFFLYDSTTRVPLILSSPTLKKERKANLAGTVDIAPTLCSLMGVPFKDTDFDGFDLFANSQESRQPVYQESMVPFLNYGWSDLRAMRSGQTRFIRSPKEEFQVFGEGPWTRDKLSKALDEVLVSGDRGITGKTAPPTDPAERRAMEALGYIWEDVDDSPLGSLADPKDRIQELEQSQEIFELVRRSKYDKAEALLRALILDSPGALDPRKILARVLKETNRLEEAYETLLSASELQGADSELFVRLAELSNTLGGDWRSHLEIAKSKNPENAIPWVLEGDFMLKERDKVGAEEAYEQALFLDKDCPSAWLGKGKIMHRNGDLEGASRALERALAADSSLPEAWFARGVVAMASKSKEKAESCFRKAIQIKPDYANAYVNLGNILFRSNQLQEARSLYEQALKLRPSHRQARLNYGALLEEVGDVEALERLRELSSD